MRVGIVFFVLKSSVGKMSFWVGTEPQEQNPQGPEPNFASVTQTNFRHGGKCSIIIIKTTAKKKGFFLSYRWISCHHHYSMGRAVAPGETNQDLKY